MQRTHINALVTLALCACGGTTTTTVADTPLDLKGSTVLPLLEGRQPVIHVTLDGRPELTFLVDTGASLSFVELQSAEQLGFELRPFSHAASARGSGGGSVEFDSYIAVGSLRAGDLELAGARLPAIEVELLRDLELVGVLGQDLLARLAVLFDMQRRELHLLGPEDHADGIAAYLGATGVGVGAWTHAPIEFEPSPLLTLEVRGEPGASGKLELDTGAVGSSFPGEVLDALGLEPIGMSRARGIDGTYEEATYELVNYGFYGLEISCQIKRSPLEYGLLGMNVLSKFVFVLDGPGEELWLHHRKPALADEE